MLKEKIRTLKLNIGEIRELVNTKIDEAKGLAENGDLDKAQVLKKEIETKKAELADLQAQLADLEDLDKMEPEKPNKSNESDEKRELGRNHILENDETKAVSDFENYIRTKGAETRDLSTTNTGVVVPEDIVNDVLELKESELDLSSLATVEKVGTKSGKFPVAKRVSAILATKEELAEIEKIDDPLFIEVDYDVQTRIGKIILSNELIEDSAINMKEFVKKQMRKMVRNTNNTNIIAILSSFAKVAGTNTDDIKTVFNVTLDPALNKTVVTNQDAFNWLDTQKDADGRYLLQPDLTSPSGKSLFGAPVYVVSNKLLKSSGTQAAPKYPVIVGDMEEAVAVFNRSEISAEWEKFDFYSSGLSIGVRNDFKQVDPDAARFIEITPAASK